MKVGTHWDLRRLSEPWQLSSKNRPLSLPQSLLDNENNKVQSKKHKGKEDKAVANGVLSHSCAADSPPAHHLPKGFCMRQPSTVWQQDIGTSQTCGQCELAIMSPKSSNYGMKKNEYSIWHTNKEVSNSVCGLPSPQLRGKEWIREKYYTATPNTTAGLPPWRKSSEAWAKHFPQFLDAT